MPIRFYIWISWMWLGLTVLYGLVNFDVTGAINPSSNNDLENTLILGQFEFFTLPFSDIRVPIPSLGFFTAVANMLTWNYPFFAGHWNFVRFFLLLPLSFAATLVFITALAPIMISVMSALGDFFGRITSIFR